MSDKNLPIKFFQKRQKDELDTEGMGKKVIPGFVDLNALIPKATYIQNVHILTKHTDINLRKKFYKELSA